MAEPNPNLILFDFDFTLVDASGCLFAAIRAGLREVGSHPPSDEQMRSLVGVSLQNQFDALRGQTDQKLFGRFRETYQRVRNELQAQGSILLPGVADALARLSRRYTLGIVSNGSVTRINDTIRRQGVDHFFKGVIIGGAADKAKAIEAALTRRGATQSSAVYVGDRPDDALVAHRAGVTFIGVATGAFGPHDFEKGTTVFPSVASLPEYLIAKS